MNSNAISIDGVVKGLRSSDPRGRRQARGAGRALNTRLKPFLSSGFRSDKSLRLALGSEMMAVCMHTLSRYGFTRKELASLSRVSEKRTGARIPATTRLFQDISDMGRLVNEWAENPRYVDSTGRPRILSITGPGPSFTTLSKGFFGKRRLEEIIQVGIATQVIERVGPNKVAQLGACVLLTGNPTLLLAHAVRSIRWFLGTANHNGHAKQGDGSWPERQAFAEISERDFKKFVKIARGPIINFTEMCNRWLMSRTAPPKRGRSNRIVIGAQAYVFRDL